MDLVERPGSSSADRFAIRFGSGSFLLPGGATRPDGAITVYYHKPERFTAQSPILIVVPGAGRDAHAYRDAWRSASEQYGVLVLAPHYPEGRYAFEDYHMGGLLSNLNLGESVNFSDTTNEAFLDEEALAYTVVGDPAQWLFGDFDRLFEGAVRATGSAQTRYDLFGHSAGGQVLHRLVLFRPASRARQVLASNAGFYTLPTFEAPLPFGLRGTPVREADLERAFATRLVLFLGEADNEHETGGTLLRSKSADLQGRHRLARGRYFYQQAEAEAARMGVPFNWSIEVVPGIGHEFERMSEVAAAYLYGDDPD